MRSRIFLVLFAAVALTGARAQDDSPSLGDVARQTRQQKQKDTKPADAKDASAKSTASKDSQTSDAESPKSKHVITNDEIPSRSGPAGYRPAAQNWNPNYKQPPYYQPAYNQPNSDAQKLPPQYWSQQMQAAKNNVTSLQAAIDRANSTQYGNCIADCVQWNLEQQRRQQQVEQMKSQLDQTQRNLEQAQDMCRQQGYGGSVCDP